MEYPEIINHINHTTRCVMKEALELNNYKVTENGTGGYKTTGFYQGSTGNELNMNFKNGMWIFNEFTESARNPDNSHGTTWRLLKELSENNPDKAVELYESITGEEIKKAVDIGKDNGKQEILNKINNEILVFNSNLNLPENQKFKDYLINERGETEETIARDKLGYSPVDNKLTIPYERGYKTFVGFIKRANPFNKKDKIKYLKASKEKYPTMADQFYNYNTFIKHPKAKRLFICEGIFDCRTFDHLNYASVADGHSMSQQARNELYELLRIYHKKPVLAFDSDPAGKQFYIRNIDRLLDAGFYDIDFVIVPNYNETVPDLNDEYISYFSSDYKFDINDFYMHNDKNIDRILKTENHVLIYLAYYYKNDFETFYKYFVRFFPHISQSKKEFIINFLKEYQVFNAFEIKQLERKKRPSDIDVVEEIIKNNTIYWDKNRGFMTFNKIWHETPKEDIYSLIGDIQGFYKDGRTYPSILKVLTGDLPRINRQYNDTPVAVFNNGTLDLKDFKFYENYFNPEHFMLWKFNVDYEPGADCPLWKKTLNEITEINDTEETNKKIAMLQEYAGSILTDENKLHKVLVLVGDGGNGKSLFYQTIADLFDNENRVIGYAGLHDLDNRFKKSELKNAVLNISGESRESFMENEEEFKKIAGGEYLQADRKNLTDIQFKARFKMIMSLNGMFRAKDKTNAIERRLLFVNFPWFFTDKEEKDLFDGERIKDIDLPDKLKQESAGIINWILAGYKRLIKNKKFTESSEHKMLLAEFISKSNPLIEFLKTENERRNITNHFRKHDKLTLKDTGLINTMWENYISECDRLRINAGTFPSFSQNLYKSLEKAYPGELIRRRDKLTNSYYIARIKPQEEETDTQIVIDPDFTPID